MYTTRLWNHRENDTFVIQIYADGALIGELESTEERPLKGRESHMLTALGTVALFQVATLAAYFEFEEEMDEFDIYVGKLTKREFNLLDRVCSRTYTSRYNKVALPQAS